MKLADGDGKPMKPRQRWCTTMNDKNGIIIVDRLAAMRARCRRSGGVFAGFAKRTRLSSRAYGIAEPSIDGVCKCVTRVRVIVAVFSGPGSIGRRHPRCKRGG